MGRPAHARIDLDALRHNYRLLKARHGGRALAVIKADAYGHGALRCAWALSTGPVQADAFAVAFLDEALALRTGGITAPILVLEGTFDADELRQAHQAGLWTVVHHAGQLAMLDALPAGANLHVWLKIDTGMHRAGFAPTAVRAAWQALQDSTRVGPVTLMSHLARADEPEAATTAAQIRCFDQATAGLHAPRSLANSAGVLGWPDAHRDWARPGIALYGASPLPQHPSTLRPVMQLRSAVFMVREVAPGEAVGYGGTWTARRPSRLGLVAMGYADGYPRTVAPGTPVLVDGHPCPLAGRVSMDMMMVDLTDHPSPAVGVGADVECWGPGLPVHTVADAAGTIAYELLCGVKRVPMGCDSGVRAAQPAGTPDHFLPSPALTLR